jgi:hypothetical protein
VERKRKLLSKFDYETGKHQLVPWPVFIRRAIVHIVMSLVAIGLADAAGTVGYHFLGHLSWLDAFLNASMILSAMGPVDRIDGTAAKLFAAFYALFSGIFFIVIIGIVLAPWAHRILHKIHLDYDEPTSPSVREER